MFICCAVLALAQTEQCEAGKCPEQSPIQRMRGAFEKYLKAQVDGDAAVYVSTLSPGLQMVINGKEDKMPWTNEAFVKSYFDKVSSKTAIYLQPISRIDDNTIVTTYQWAVTVKSTKEDIEFGAWNTKVTFDANGLITTIDVVCDGLPLKYLESALALYKHDKKSIFTGYLNTFAKKDVTGTRQFLSDNLVVKRNGQPDVVQWQDPAFLTVLHKHTAAVKAESLLFVDAGNRAAEAHIRWTFAMANDSGNQPITVYDAWHLTFHPQEPRIAVVASTVDMSALLQVYSFMAEDIQALQQQFQQRNQQQQQQGQPA